MTGVLVAIGGSASRGIRKAPQEVVTGPSSVQSGEAFTG